MGNQLVIPPTGDWYVEPLKKQGIRCLNPIDSGTFFITLEAVDENGIPQIVKTYQYIEPLQNIKIVADSLRYYDFLNKYIRSTENVIPFHKFFIQDRMVFLIRKKMDYTLTERLQISPFLEDIEKLWISFQLLTSIFTLHSINLTHGSLNPDNVFVGWDCKLKIGDMSPYKPFRIRYDRPHVYYHFFGSLSSNRCYLAPEQLTDTGETHEYGLPTSESDLFSAGLIIYYIYSGNDLFSFSTLYQYKKSQFDIDPHLSIIPDDIRPMVNQLLSLNPSDRKGIVKAVYSFFPPVFGQINSQIAVFEFDDTSLNRLIDLGPVFTHFAEVYTGIRIILANAFIQFLLTSNEFQAILKFSDFLIEFVSPLEDEIKATRFLPAFVGLLGYKNDLIKSKALRCINDLLSQIDKLQSKDITSVFLLNALLKTMDEHSFNFRCTLFEIIPSLVIHLLRIDPDCKNVSQLIQVLITETNPTFLNAFRLGMSNVKDLTPFFTYILSSFNNANRPIEKVEMLGSFTKGTLPMQFLENIAHAVLGFASSDARDDEAEVMLEFLVWYCQEGQLNESLYGELLDLILKYVNSQNPRILSLVRALIQYLPKDRVAPIMPRYILKNEQKEIERRVSKNNRTPIQTPNITFKPAFLIGHRITRHPIASTTSFDHGALLGTTHGNLFYSTPATWNEIICVEEKINSICCFSPTDVLVSTKSKTYSIDPTLSSIIDICNGFSQMTKLSSNVFIGTGHELVMKDRRTSVDIFKQELQLTTTSICSWEDGVLFGLGFKEGLVTLMDSRVFLPVSNVITDSVKMLTPYPGGYTAFVASSSRRFVIYDPELREPMMDVPAGNCVLGGIQYGIIAANIDHVLAVNNFNLQKLSCGYSMLIPSDDSPFAELPITTTTRDTSLHHHQSPITSIASNENMQITTDVLGNVHFWYI